MCMVARNLYFNYTVIISLSFSASISSILASAEAYRVPVKILFNKVDAYDEGAVSEVIEKFVLGEDHE